MPTVVSIRNDTVPGDGADVRVYLQPTAVSDRTPTQRLLVTAAPLKPGESVGVSIAPHMHIVVTP